MIRETGRFHVRRENGVVYDAIESHTFNEIGGKLQRLPGTGSFQTVSGGVLVPTREVGVFEMGADGVRVTRVQE